MKQKKRAEKSTKKKMPKQTTKVNTEIDVSDAEPTESGLQDNEISNSECAVCFGLYEDDLSMTGKLEREWVQCTNELCGKWMHSECLDKENNMFVCGLCNMLFC